jgi:hypothetical protein
MGVDNPYLILESADGEHIALKNPMTFGRVQGNDVVFSDIGCSARHAVIRQSESAWVIEDLGSTNGTWIGGEQLQGIRQLHEGDVIQMGAQTLRICGLGEELRCARCGTVPLKDATFCPTCGIPLKAGDPGETVAMPPPRKPELKAASPQTKSFERPGVTHPQVSPAPAAAPVKPKAKNRSVLLAGIAAAGLVILAIPVVFLWPRISGFIHGHGSTAGKHLLPLKNAVLKEAILFRKGASSSNLPKTIEAYHGKSALRIIVDSPMYKEAPAVWSYFFSGSIILGGNLESPNPIIAFYNPFLDGVLLTQWDMQGGSPQIIGADLRIASRMTAQKAANPSLAWWVSEMSKRPIPQVLKEQYNAFLPAFTREFPVDSNQVIKLEAGQEAANSRAILERQAMASFANLVNLQNPKSPVFSQDLATLKKALRTGDVPALARMMPANNPMKAETLAGQPGWIRQSAVPMYALAGNTKMIVLLAPSDAPRFYLLATWTKKPAPHLEAVVPYDMDGSVFKPPKNANGTEVNS